MHVVGGHIGAAETVQIHAANTQPTGPGNVYTNAQTAEGWQDTEGNRLRTMREYVDSVSRDDLGPVIATLQAERPGRQLELIDLGCGPDRGVEEFCAENAVGYTGYDGNPVFLQQRGTDPFRTIQGRLEDMSSIPDGVYDITFSRAATAWSSDPDRTIAEQLRITGDTAVFTEYDWAPASVMCGHMDVLGAGIAAKATMICVLEAAGFNAEFGAGLHERVARVAAECGYDVESITSEMHELSGGANNRDLFLESANTICAQLRAVRGDPATSRAKKIQSAMMLSRLEHYKSIIEQAPAGSMAITLPPLHTTIVRKRVQAQ